MRDIESKISPLISGLFPSFYQTDGPNFIAFIKAYYEWLEQNFQLLDLESVENFNVGDTVQQQNVTGTIFSVDGNSILVLVDGLETFKCFNVCSELIPVTSSSGGNTFILRGGTTRRLGTIFLSRNLSKIRDIDKTLDLFVVRFKEKYLKNIEFDTQTNKKLLVKNSLDLYRSKGTARSIDLFFRLIYGVKSSVYYPGDDLFRLSDAEWFKPQYIEINSTSVDRAITLVGRQITGVNSGATAFVERYVKKKVNAGFVHAFYISNVRGTFEVNERLKYVQIFPDSPRIVGSFTGATVIEGSESFQVGDLVNFESVTGLGGIGRVTSTVKGSGEVSFRLGNTGWGYTTNRVGSETAFTSNTFLSDTILLLANVEAGQFLSNVSPVIRGSGYSNNDTIFVSSRYARGVAKPSTNTSGGILSVKVLDRGAGFYPSVETPVVSVVNSTGFTSAGVGATWSLDYTYPKKYFEYLETITQPLSFVTYHNDLNIDLMTPGSLIEINNVNEFGRLVDINTNSNTMIISMFNRDVINSGDVIYLEANTASKVDVITVSSSNTTGRVISVSNTGTIEIGTPRGVFAVGDVVYQKDAQGDIVASATITKTSGLTLAGGFISVSNISGVFRPEASILIAGKGTTTNSEFRTITFNAAVVSSSNTFVDTFGPFVYSANNGVKAFVASKSSGSNAQYRIASLIDTQDVKLNTDRLSNTVLLNTRLNAVQFGLPYRPTANISSVIYGALAFEGMTVGAIRTLGDLNPGSGYNRDPVASPFQPFITGYQARDYIFTISNNQSSFAVGEYITQVNPKSFVKVSVSNTEPYRYGEKVFAANTTTNFIANGVVFYVDNIAKYIDLELTEGTFPTTNNFTLKSFITTANSFITNAVPFTGSTTARGQVKDNIGDKLYVKRIQLDNIFQPNKIIRGNLSGTTANVVSIVIDPNSDPAGLNASVNGRASTANGVVSQVQIIDSGYGFSNDDEIVFRTTTDEREGLVSNIKGGVGTGTGFYRTAEGFLSDVSKVHDGDYYQEYSYDILSRIPIEKYATMFKKVMHTAGTRFFGSVLIDSLANTIVSVANSAIEITDDSPYTIQDRESIDVQDRGELFIEIRE
ncbi:hypothetical protein UFOVP447_86 [uncultured Caudovirales phage]|uniref:Uncharacterized protein n=1 Tax=uncultured Caudovirales phage TaxID=2100421 RepID=A0A6J5M908_9CAUD|nr:hypothetical protein UFOVP447_86 [uncultured Caudovirales phage]